MSVKRYLITYTYLITGKSHCNVLKFDIMKLLIESLVFFHCPICNFCLGCAS